MRYIAIVGDSPLSVAELQSRFKHIKKLSNNVILFESNQKVDISTFGSVIKFAEVIKTTSQKNDLSVMSFQAIKNFCEHAKVAKIDFAVSQYLNKPLYRIDQTIKKLLIQKGISSRYVKGSQNNLSSASVLHNKLDSKNIELVIVRNNQSYLLAQTIAVQPIDTYRKRDMLRPRRDLKVGMLPPKLAQILISLSQISRGELIYDPFCGSGVVLQEAMLQGVDVWGADINQKMIDNSKKNLNWLGAEFKLNANSKLFVQDASKVVLSPNSKYRIVTEGFLGVPLKTLPDQNQVIAQSKTIQNLYLSFLKNVSLLSHKPEQVVITLPCWQTKDGLKKLDIIDQIVELGYTIIQFKLVEPLNLIYLRDNQIVGRQVLVLKLSK